jgi:hypothetical protein
LAERTEDPESGRLTIKIVDLLTLLAVANGLLLLAVRPWSGVAGLTLAFLFVVVSKWKGERARKRRDRTEARSYCRWLLDRAIIVSESYDDLIELNCAPDDAYASYTKTPLSTQMPLCSLEFITIELMATAIGTDSATLISRAIASDVPEALELDGATYVPRNNFARFLLGSTQDKRFARLSLREWIIEGKDFLFIPKESRAQ